MCRLLAALALACGAAGCGRAPGPEAGNAPQPLAVVFTGDLNGRIEPCGCFTGQMGGLTRLRTWLEATVPGDALRVDVGDALAGAEDYHLIQYRHLHTALAGMGWEAMNLGRREAALPLERLRALVADAAVPVISANLHDAATGRPVALPSLVVTRGTLRIGIVGVVDPASLPERSPGPGLAVRDPEEAIRDALTELLPRTDARVLLAFADEGRLRALAERFYEFQLVLGGDVRQPSRDIARVNRSSLLWITNEARAAGLWRGVVVPGPVPRLERESAKVELLHDRIPQHTAVRAVVQAFRDEVRRTRLDVDEPERAGPDEVPGVRSPLTYTGSQACAACHAAEMKTWEASGHARAFAALEARGSDADPTCIGCHTVGFGAPGGYRRAYGREKLTNVGCESCHGPGSQHVAERLAGGEALFRFRPLGAADCMACHHGEFSRPFTWEGFWPAVAHGRTHRKAAEAGAAKPTSPANGGTAPAQETGGVNPGR